MTTEIELHLRYSVVDRSFLESFNGVVHKVFVFLFFFVIEYVMGYWIEMAAWLLSSGNKVSLFTVDAFKIF